MSNYLEKLKEKCEVNDNFIEIIQSLFDKLIHFGYITRNEEKKLQKKLYNNIDNILIGNDISVDYKSGYYDAIKKELYIKDLSNIESIYLRLLYVLSTTNIEKEERIIGYSTSTLSKNSYRIIHNNFGINRAVSSNLVCRLLYTIPTTLSIVPTYRTYENDFLGNKVDSDNDIYFLEGKILKQICFTFGIHEEELYIHLFSKNPKKSLRQIFKNITFDTRKRLFEIFDKLSRKYSNYNKLYYLNLLLDKNYLAIKKNILENDISELKKEEQKIKNAIRVAISKLNPDNEIDESDNEINIDESLSEQINTLEEEILSYISDIQNILVDYLTNIKFKFSAIEYAIKLRELENILITSNEALNNTIYDVIYNNLLNGFENHDSNLTQKLKYSLINFILSNDKYIRIYKELSFKKLNIIDPKGDDSSIIALTVDNSFMQLVEITNTKLPMKEINRNTRGIQINNLRYLLNNPSASNDIQKIEKIYTNIKTKHDKYNNIGIENFYSFTYNSNEYILVILHDNFNILRVELKEDDEFNTKHIKLSDNFNIFTSNSNMPVIYKNNENSKLKKLSMFFGIFFS